jgi:hypothetical protein
MGSVIEDMIKASADVEAICAAHPPRPHHGAFLAAVNALWPGIQFNHALSRSRWYRLGGVVTATGERVSTDIEEWANLAWQACGEDPAEFAETFGGQQLLATRIIGRTHYFVAPYGPSSAEFLQMEIEELQEVSDRRLFDPENLPGDLQDLVDPSSPLAVEPMPLDDSRYVLRRFADVRSFLEEMEWAAGTPPLVARFLNEWQQSSASHAARFCQEWVLALGEHLDRFKQTLRTAVPIAAPRKESGPYRDAAQEGAQLANAIIDYDQHAGYPFAWYFHMVTNRGIPRAIAARVVQDLDAGFSYIPERDAVILRGWVESPYSI